jgi:hypothetical protein
MDVFRHSKERSPDWLYLFCRKHVCAFRHFREDNRFGAAASLCAFIASTVLVNAVVVFTHFAAASSSSMGTSFLSPIALAIAEGVGVMAIAVAHRVDVSRWPTQLMAEPIVAGVIASHCFN